MRSMVEGHAVDRQTSIGGHWEAYQRDGMQTEGAPPPPCGWSPSPCRGGTDDSFPPFSPYTRTNVKRESGH